MAARTKRLTVQCSGLNPDRGRETHSWTFAGRVARDLKGWLDGQAEQAHSNEDLAQRLVEEC